MNFNINSVPETAYGFRTKLNFFVDRIEILRQKLGKEKSGIKILDFGCGNGRQVTLPLGAEGYFVVGIDLHEPTIALVKSENNFKNVEFIAGDIKQVAEKGKFDVVILSDVLEHLPHPENLLREIKNILSPHGIILISIPNGCGPFEIENFILRKLGILKVGRALKRGKNSDLQTLNCESGHVQFFTQKSFEKLAQAAELRISDFKKGSVFCGPISARILSLLPVFEKFNIKAGSFLPAAFCSVWYFEIRKKEEGIRKKGGGYPRLLIISSSAFNPLSGGGITFTNLFHGWPKDKIATVHSDKIKPSVDVCEKYYFLSSKEFVWGFPFSLAKIFGLQEQLENLAREAKGVAVHGDSGSGGILKNLLKLILPLFQRFFKNEIPTDVRISAELEKFIDNFKPEVIYTILGSLPYINLVKKVSERYNLPVVIHMMDDWPAVRYRKEQKELRELIKNSAVCLGICSAMCEAYEKRYSRKFLPFANALDSENWLKKARKNWRRSSPFKILYAGALMPDSQLGSLIDVCDAVFELDREGLDIEMEIYAPWFSAKHYRGKLERPSCVKVFDAPEKMDSEELFAKANLLLLPVNFDSATIKYVKYSMPTKVPAYMFSGTPTFAYGPKEVASIQYASEWAYCVFNKNKKELKDAIKHLAQDEELRKKLAIHAQKLAIERHDRKIVGSKFQQILIDVVNR